MAARLANTAAASSPEKVTPTMQDSTYRKQGHSLKPIYFNCPSFSK